MEGTQKLEGDTADSGASGVGRVEEQRLCVYGWMRSVGRQGMKE